MRILQILLLSCVFAFSQLANASQQSILPPLESSAQWCANKLEEVSDQFITNNLSAEAIFGQRSIQTVAFTKSEIRQWVVDYNNWATETGGAYIDDNKSLSLAVVSENENGQNVEYLVVTVLAYNQSVESSVRIELNSLLLTLNDLEPVVNTFGLTLRDWDSSIARNVWANIGNNDIQSAVESSITQLKNSCISNFIDATSCPQLPVNDTVTRVGQLASVAGNPLSSGEQAEVRKLVDKANTGALLACAVGNSETFTRFIDENEFELTFNQNGYEFVNLDGLFTNIGFLEALERLLSSGEGALGSFKVISEFLSTLKLDLVGLRTFFNDLSLLIAQAQQEFLDSALVLEHHISDSLKWCSARIEQTGVTDFDNVAASSFFTLPVVNHRPITTPEFISVLQHFNSYAKSSYSEKTFSVTISNSGNSQIANVVIDDLAGENIATVNIELTEWLNAINTVERNLNEIGLTLFADEEGYRFIDADGNPIKLSDELKDVWASSINLNAFETVLDQYINNINQQVDQCIDNITASCPTINEKDIERTMGVADTDPKYATVLKFVRETNKATKIACGLGISEVRPETVTYTENGKLYIDLQATYVDPTFEAVANVLYDGAIAAIAAIPTASEYVSDIQAGLNNVHATFAQIDIFLQSTVDNIGQLLAPIQPNLDWCSTQLSKVDFDKVGSVLTVDEILNLQPIEYVAFTNREIDQIMSDYQDYIDGNPTMTAFGLSQEVEGGQTYLVFSATDPETNEVTRVRQNKADLIAQLNSMEQSLTALGITLRNPSHDAIVEIWANLQNPKHFEEQLTNELNLLKKNIEDAASQCALSYIVPEDCPQINIDDVITYFNKELGEHVELKDGQKAKIEEFVFKANDAAKVACTLGQLSFPNVDTYRLDGFTYIDFEAAFPGIDLSGFIDAIYARFDQIMGEFPSIDNFLSAFRLELDSIKLSLQAIEAELNLYLTEFELQLQAQLAQLKIDAGVDGIDLSQYAGVDRPAPPPLDLKKRKEWKGFSFGDRSVFSAEAFADAELRGGQKGHSFQAYGFVGSYIIDKPIALVSGVAEATSGYFDEEGKTVDEEGNTITNLRQRYNVELEVFGENWIDEKGSRANDSQDSGILYQADTDLYNFQYGFATKIPVGPILVGLEVGAGMGIGYSAQVGMGPLNLYAEMTPNADAYAFVEVNVGIIVVEAGARAELTIIDLAIPLGAEAELSMNSKMQPSLNLNLYGDVDYTSMKGQAYVFVRYYVPRVGIPPWKKKEKRKSLFKWKGNHSSRRIISWGIGYGPDGKKVSGGGSLTKASQDLEQGLIELDGDATDENPLWSKATLINQYRETVMTTTDRFHARVYSELASGGLYQENAAATYDLAVEMTNVELAAKAEADRYIIKRNTTDPEYMDTDNDGITNAEEERLGTNPGEADSDGDGMDDKYELDNGLDPHNDDTTYDKDNDGFSNIDEYNAGTPANNAAIDPSNKHILYLIPIFGLLNG